MKFCQSHWDALRQAIDDRGLSNLIAKNGEVATNQIRRQLQGDDLKETYDPLMAAHWAILNNALSAGGLYLMGNNPDADDGHYCPICESEKHGGYPADWWIAHAADEQLEKARTLGLAPRPS